MNDIQADPSSGGTDAAGTASGPASGDEPGQPVSVVLGADDEEPPSTSWLADRLRQAVRAAGIRVDQFTVIIIDDLHMTDLHGRFRGEACTTDVLTFDLSDPGADGGADHGADAIDAEVYICLDEARRQAARRGHDVDRELLLYAIHGLMHLSGHDDHDPAACAAMHAAEDDLLESIGVGPVYGRSAHHEERH